MTDGVVAVDSNQRVILWNRAAEELLGVSAKKALGQYCYEIVCGRDEQSARLCRQACQMMVLAKQGKPVPSSDMFTVAQAGQQLWLNVSHVVAHKTGHRLTLVHIFRDISQHKAMEHLIHQLSTALDGLRKRGPSAGPEQFRGERRTRREHQVLKLLAEGGSTSAIAEQLHISRFTVRNHIQKILSKLGAHSRAEAVAVALRNHLL